MEAYVADILPSHVYYRYQPVHGDSCFEKYVRQRKYKDHQFQVLNVNNLQSSFKTYKPGSAPCYKPILQCVLLVG
jgi:hypothetical protein